MQAEGVVEHYAIGGAVGATFYLEPVATLDIDVFVMFRSGGLIIDPTPVFDWLKAQGGTLEGEYVMLAATPMQILAANSPLVEEAIRTAVEADGTIENILAGDGRDSLTGNAVDNTILGGRGDDRLLGGGGDDTIEGGPGEDLLRGDGGNDDLQGGAGDDEIYAGEDDDGDDTVSGGAGDDVAAGGAGADTIITTSGADTLYGGAGNDDINQQGVDPTGAGDLVWAGSGEDVVTLGGGADTIGGGEGDDSLTGGAGADVFYGGRDGGDDTVFGDGGGDIVYAGDGDDTVFGGAEADEIFNGAGADRVEGGDGDDSLYGSPGDDRLFGDGPGSSDGGADTFLFFADSGDDIVSDFDTAVDRIAFHVPFESILFDANADGDAVAATDEMSVTFLGLTVAEMDDPTLFV